MIPIPIKLAYSVFLASVIPVYWRQYGAANFLWFSDIALIVTGMALWLESALLVSTQAVGVIALEAVWNVDFLVRLVSGKSLIGLSAYMFDAKLGLGLRALSLFHVWLPPFLVWLVARLGYDRRALLVQTAVAWIVLPLSYAVSSREENINWVFGPQSGVERWMPRAVYLGLLLVAFPLFLYLPTHAALRTLFGE